MKSPPKTDPKKPRPFKRNSVPIVLAGATFISCVVLFFMFLRNGESPLPKEETKHDSLGHTNAKVPLSEETWIERSSLIDKQFHRVYTAGWEGANGAIGDAYLYAATNDESLLLFHAKEHELRNLFNGTWVDDRAWASLAELYWWDFTGRNNMAWVADAAERYQSAKKEGRLSSHEGYWTWYNWPPGARLNEPIFTNSNMNQMVSVACRLYEATGHKEYLQDALRVWNGDGVIPGIEKQLYRGDGRWEGNPGKAAFGKELPWSGLAYSSIGANLYRVTNEEKYRKVAVATAKRIMNPANGWVAPDYFYQVHMDGNGNFVHFLLDAYEIAPEELSDIPQKVESMLDHVWTNNYGQSRVILHRESDHGIRNGWNPLGGEDGYGVGEVGTVHAQSQAIRAFGVFTYFKLKANLK